MAVEAGFAEVCDLLLKARCDVRKETFRGKIPLYAAAEMNRMDIVRLLLPYALIPPACCSLLFVPPPVNSFVLPRIEKLKKHMLLEISMKRFFRSDPWQNRSILCSIFSFFPFFLA